MSKYFYTFTFILLLNSHVLNAQSTDGIFGARQVITTINIPDGLSYQDDRYRLSGSVDLNSDGLLDYYLKLNETIYGILNLGNGEFTEPSIVTGLYEGTTDLEFVDLDSDGDMDLLYTSNRVFKPEKSSFNEQAVYYRENKNGVFQRSIAITELAGGSRLNAYFVDIDGDNDLDIVTYHYKNYPELIINFSLIENLENLEFSEESILIDNPHIFKHHQFIDINNDGNIDLVGEDLSIGMVFYLGKGNKEYSEVNYFQIDKPYYNLYQFTFADIDQDGIKDIVTPKEVRISGEGHAYYYESSVEYYNYAQERDQGPHTLFEHNGYFISNSIFIDIDLDSDMDYFFTSGDFEGYDSDIWWSKNNSPSSFSSPIKTTVNLAPINYNDKTYQKIVGFFDIDNDGYPDAVTSFKTEDNTFGLAWYKNQTSPVVDTEKPLENLPTKTKLLKNYPNPFNPTTNFVFSLKSADRIEFRVFDSLGRTVANITPKLYGTGTHEVSFDASALPSGVYFYRMIGTDFIDTNKFTLLK